MGLLEKIRQQIVTATKLRKDVKKNILKVLIGEVERRYTGKDVTDEDIVKIAKKLIAGNTETMSHIMGGSSPPNEQYAECFAKLEQENNCLEDIIPKQLDRVDILLALADVVGSIQSAKADGPAIGLAIKHLKSKSLIVSGDEVSALVKELRSKNYVNCS